MTATGETQIQTLRDGDEFSTDGGQTWHTFAVAGFGTASCYRHPEQPRNGRSLTYRVPLAADASVLVRR